VILADTTVIVIVFARLVNGGHQVGRPYVSYKKTDLCLCVFLARGGIMSSQVSGAYGIDAYGIGAYGTDRIRAKEAKK